VTRVLVYEDESIRRYEVFNEDGQLVGIDEESKAPPAPDPCWACGRAF
jgi:hypothetical protein